ncbi:MAG TPA: hypothetical protein VGN34_34740 [Ktedonobacteraceae bacterium]|jgi:hypothetical protein
MAKDSAQLDDLRQAGEQGERGPGIGILWWVSVIVILGALLLLAGAVISKVAPTMLTDGRVVTEAARVYTDYFFARNLPLAVLLLLLLAIRARKMLAGFMVLVALIQIVDVINDLMRGAFLLVPGLLVFAIVFFLGAWKLCGQAIWRVTAWRD